MRAHGWDDALDTMQELDRVIQTPSGTHFLTRFVESHGVKRWNPAREDYDYVVNKAEVVKHYEGLGIATVAALRAGDPCWVSDEVVELVEIAAQTWKFEPVFPDDVMVPSAFVLLERSLGVKDAKDMWMNYRGISWHAVHNPDGTDLGLSIALWSDSREPDDYDREFEAAHPGVRMGMSNEIKTPWALTHVALFEWGKDYTDEGGDLIAHLQVLWRLAQQEIALPKQERASRPAWRRAAKWREIKRVVVMTLRRSKPHYTEGDGEGREWSHRWLVSGHWRAQPYKIKGEGNEPDRWVRRQIWIAPYVKGPDDKPFVAKQHAIEFIR